jgi:hypothetical protein
VLRNIKMFTKHSRLFQETGDTVEISRHLLKTFTMFWVCNIDGKNIKCEETLK